MIKIIKKFISYKKRKNDIKKNPYDFFRMYKEYFSEKEFIHLYYDEIKDYRFKILDRIKKINANFYEKKYKVEFLLEQILKDSVQKKDLIKFIEYQIHAFLFCYDKLHKEIEELLSKKTKICLYSNETFTTKIKHLFGLIQDSQELIQYYEAANGNISHYNIFINRIITGRDVFWYTCLMINGINDISNKAYYSNLAYLIRDSLEIRIKNALGISEIKSNTGACKVTSDVFIDFLFKNSNIHMPQSINKSILKKIFAWTNYHIHLGIVLYKWQFLLILEYIKPLFGSAQLGTQINYHSAIVIDRNYYKTQLANDLVNYLVLLRKNVTNVILNNSPECMLV